MINIKEKLYTLRWYAKKALSIAPNDDLKRLCEDQIVIIGELLGEPVTPPIDNVNPIDVHPAKDKPGLRSEWYPKGHISQYKMRTKGKYEKGWPLGAVVHFTAGRDGAEKTIKGGVENGYAYLCIQKDGKIYQAHPMSEWGYHAGESAWKHLAKKLVGAVSDDLVGIEINNAGRLTEKSGRLYTWFGVEVPKDNARYTPGKENQLKGWYEKYTPEQEKTLIEFLLWCKNQAPDVFDFDFVLGHDEVAGPAGIGRWRKNDPGASLSMTMPEFRALLKQKYKEVYG